MNNELLDIFLLGLLAMATPSPLAAVTAMLFLASALPERLVASGGEHEREITLL